MDRSMAQAADAQKLWNAYSRAKDPVARERLILKYAPLVKALASRMCLSLPPQAQFDDLVAYGVLGLIEAIERFRPEMGVKFEVYASSRIKGAILDGLRKMDWVPTGIRRRTKELLRTYARLEQELGRTPSELEVAEKLGMDKEELARRMQEAALAVQCSLDDLGIAEGVRPATSAQESIPSPEAEMERAERRRLVAEGIRRLSEKERIVVSLIYHEGLSGREVAKILGVSASRVSQVHSRALVRMKAYLLSVLEGD